MITNFYVYAYLRKDKSPYYIGKGKDNRAYNHSKNDSIKTPKNKSNIIFLETNLSEVGALALERRMIRWYGRKDNNTGILRNRTDGGDGVTGYKHTTENKAKIGKASSGRVHAKGRIPSAETRKKISKANKGKKKPPRSAKVRKNMSNGQKNRKRNENDFNNLKSMTEKIKLKIEVCGIVYNSIRDGAKALGIHEETLRCRCRNKNFIDYKIIGEQNA